MFEFLAGLDATAITAIVGAIGILIGKFGEQWRANRKQSADLISEQHKQIAGRTEKLSDSLSERAEYWRRLYEREAERLDKEQENRAEREAHTARLEERLASMDNRLEEISTATWEGRAKTPQTVTAEPRDA